MIFSVGYGTGNRQEYIMLVSCKYSSHRIISHSLQFYSSWQYSHSSLTNIITDQMQSNMSLPLISLAGVLLAVLNESPIDYCTAPQPALVRKWEWPLSITGNLNIFSTEHKINCPKILQSSLHSRETNISPLCHK